MKYGEDFTKFCGLLRIYELYFTTPTGGLNSTKTNLAEDMSSEAANLIGSLSRHTEDSLNIENLNIESRQNLYGPELDIRPLEIPGAVIN